MEHLFNVLVCVVFVRDVFTEMDGKTVATSQPQGPQSDLGPAKLSCEEYPGFPFFVFL